MARSSIHIIEDVTGSETIASPSITFDVVTAFSPTKSRAVTNSPVSTGTIVSEILADKGGRVAMEAYVSNNPIVINPLNIIDTENSDVRTQAAYVVLDKLYKSKNTVTLVYKFDSLTSYMLTSFEPIMMPSDTIGFRLQFEEVRFAVESQLQLVENMSIPLARSASTATNGGIVDKKDATPKEAGAFATTFGVFADL
jgi:hypothetical protein